VEELNDLKAEAMRSSYGHSESMFPVTNLDEYARANHFLETYPDVVERGT